MISDLHHNNISDRQAIVVKDDADFTVTVQKVHDPDTGETLLYCHSSQREKKETVINQLFSTRFEVALEYLKQGLGMKRWLKKYDKAVEKIGRLKQQFSKAGKLYNVQVEKDDKTGNAKTITWQRKAAPKTTDTSPGVYCLRTSQADWDESTLWNTYTTRIHSKNLDATKLKESPISGIPKRTRNRSHILCLRYAPTA